MASKNLRIETLEEWVFQNKLFSKEERRKALEAVVSDSDRHEYLKSVISRNKAKNIQKPRIQLFPF